MTRRAAATVALAAVAALTLPVAPASACSMPTGYLDAGTAPLPSGATVAVSGDVVADANGRVPMCSMPVPPPISGTPGETPSGSPEPEPSVSASGGPAITPPPVVTLPPLLPVAYARGEVEVWIATAPVYDPAWVPPGPARTIGTVDATPRTRWGGDGLYSYTFSGRVTIPADIAPGRYHLGAHQEGVVSWGHITVDVVAGLPETGAETVPLVRLAVLSLLAGAGALAGARRVRA